MLSDMLKAGCKPRHLDSESFPSFNQDAILTHKDLKTEIECRRKLHKSKKQCGWVKFDERANMLISETKRMKGNPFTQALFHYKIFPVTKYKEI